MSPVSDFSGVLASLIRHRGVRGSLIVMEADGIIVDSNLQIGQQGDRLAALAASLHRKARLAAHAAGLGAATLMQLEAENGRILAAGRGELVLVVIADPAANVGLIRVEMLRAVEGLG